MPFDRIRLMMLKDRTWRYLRYIHMREAVLSSLDTSTTMLSVGAGKGFAEMAIALEFPSLHVTITDYDEQRLAQAEKTAKHLRIPNVSIYPLDVFNPGPAVADLVVSVEMLEHLEDDRTAAANLRAMARKSVFCLVPFADKALQADESARRKVFEQCEHVRVGYDADDLVSLFGAPITMHGCYWSDAGILFRQRLYDLADSEISLSLHSEAVRDIRSEVPTASKQAYGIWTLTAP
jgi:16S rRNA G527 N7-methylase RsmG